MKEIKIGDVFTFLTVKGLLEKKTKKGGAIYLCQCKCGNLYRII